MLSFWSLALAASAVSAVSIAEIQGPAFLSPLAGKKVTIEEAIVTAKGDSGFWIQEDASDDKRVSSGLYVFSTSNTTLAKVKVGDSISLAGSVSEYKSTAAYLSLTELGSPTNITVLSSGHTVEPLIIGKDVSPPVLELSALDVGDDGWLSVPNNSSLQERVNATLVPEKYGLDFWESLEGQLVLIPSPIALNFENQYGEFWVHGDWEVSGKNSRGGLTLTRANGSVPDANPEAIQIGEPLDGTNSPAVALGVGLSDIVGVVTYAFGFYQVLPLTAPEIISRPEEDPAPSTLFPDDGACSVLVGDYNIENMTPTSKHMPIVADHIGNYLNTPDLMFIQEVQDDNGATDNGTVSANLTLTNLVNAIANVTGVVYDFIDIPPVNDQDGGEPGGNIRTAYLYRCDKLTLVDAPAFGNSTQSVEVVSPSEDGSPATLSVNPGRIDPTNGVWNATRKPLVAQWQTADGEATFFTINLHLSSKGGSSSSEGNARPPVNSPIAARTGQVESVMKFVKSLLDVEPEANIMVSGDWNEYQYTSSVFASAKDLLYDLEEVAEIDPVERYTYVYDQNSQQLDHIFISKALSERCVEAEHIHVNTWSPSYDDRISDHDPTVAMINLC